jgi:osmotically-inducible protein OsmY
MVAILAGAAGAAAMYLLDPVTGRGRRAVLADRTAAMMRDAGQRLERGQRYAKAQVGGALQGISHLGDGGPMPNDASLTAKVETELFRDPSVPKGKININVEQGTVVMRGEVSTQRQRDTLERRAERIPGVAGVENLLHLPGEPVLAAPARGEPVISSDTDVGPILP